METKWRIQKHLTETEANQISQAALEHGNLSRVVEDNVYRIEEDMFKRMVDEFKDGYINLDLEIDDLPPEMIQEIVKRHEQLRAALEEATVHVVVNDKRFVIKSTELHEHIDSLTEKLAVAVVY